MKKIITSLTIASTLAPMAAVVSCSSNDEQGNIRKYHLLPTYTAQADQLISLGIKPDYYPLQLDQNKIFNYLSNPSQFMEVQSEEFKRDFSNKIQTLLPKDRGSSWWNQQALNDGERGSDPEYWQHISGDVVLYEHYLLDDGLKKLSYSTSPKHKPYWRTFIETNFRESRDPFTRMPRSIMEALLDQDSYDLAPQSVKNEVKKLLDVARTIEEVDPNRKAVDGKPMPTGYVLLPAPEDKSWIYNDFVYARHFHENYLDNNDFQSSSVKGLILNLNPLDSNGMDSRATDWVFNKDSSIDKKVAKLFYESTYKPEEEGIKNISKLAYFGPTRQKRHHPVYEQQEEIGGAPMFEGAQRENLLYFYNTADKLQNAFSPAKPLPSNATLNEVKEHEISNSALEFLKNTFDVPRFNKMAHARENANLIIEQVKTRMKAIRKLVDAAHNPVYGIFTLAPGAGKSTIQSSSKYSFLYNELNFKQPSPTNLDDMTSSKEAIENNTPGGGDENAFFNMDDNGWWWNLNDDSGLINRSGHFKNQFDMGALTANQIQFDNLKQSDKQAIASMYKDISVDKLSDIQVSYNLWNEGLKTPFVIHMILDHITKQLLDKYPTEINASLSSAEIQAAKNWGSYFTDTFIKT